MAPLAELGLAFTAHLEFDDNGYSRVLPFSLLEVESRVDRDSAVVICWRLGRVVILAASLLICAWFLALLCLRGHHVRLFGFLMLAFQGSSDVP